MLMSRSVAALVSLQMILMPVAASAKTHAEKKPARKIASEQAQLQNNLDEVLQQAGGQDAWVIKDSDGASIPANELVDHTAPKSFTIDSPAHDGAPALHWMISESISGKNVVMNIEGQDMKGKTVLKKRSITLEAGLSKEEFNTQVEAFLSDAAEEVGRSVHASNSVLDSLVPSAHAGTGLSFLRAVVFIAGLVGLVVVADSLYEAHNTTALIALAVYWVASHTKIKSYYYGGGSIDFKVPHRSE